MEHLNLAISLKPLHNQITNQEELAITLKCAE